MKGNKEEGRKEGRRKGGRKGRKTGGGEEKDGRWEGGYIDVGR